MAEHLNPVEVDVDAELATLAQLGAEATAEEVADQATAEAVTHDPNAWKQAGDATADIFAGVIVPGWQLEDGDKAQISGAVAGVLDRYFPGAIQGADTWHPLAQLAFVLATVTAARGIEYSTLSIKPLRLKKATDNGDGEAAGRDPSLPHGDEPVGENRKPFTMGGG